MILGPDLIGWRLTEARLWAMLRDEEALQVKPKKLENCTIHHGGNDYEQEGQFSTIGFSTDYILSPCTCNLDALFDLRDILISPME